MVHSLPHLPLLARPSLQHSHPSAPVGSSPHAELSINRYQILSRPEIHMKLHSFNVESLMSPNRANFNPAEKRDSIAKESSKTTEVGMFDYIKCSSEDVRLVTSGHTVLSMDILSPLVLSEDTDEYTMKDDASRLPLIEDFIGSLQKCKTSKHLADAKSMYLYICSVGLEAQDAVRNHILLMFVKCGSVSSAQQVFNILSYRSENSWTSLIIGYVQSGRPRHALELYPTMREDSVLANSYTLVALVKACTLLKDLRQGQEMHIQIVQKGLEQALPVGSTLISMYAGCGCIEDAHVVFRSLPSRDLVSWTALISGYVEYGCSETAIDCFEQMKQEGIIPDAFTVACILKAYGNVGALEKGRQIHKEISQAEFRRDLFVSYSLVGMYAKCGALSEARQAFDELPVQGIVPWNSLIGGYANHGCWQEALECYEQMASHGVLPDAITFASVLRVCGSFGVVDTGRYVHIDCIQKGCEDSTLVGNSLVGMYSKCGAFLEAEKVFDSLPCKDVISWTALISGYAEHRPLVDALSHFEKMQVAGISPNAATFASILKGCGSAECINVGREVHMAILKMGLETSVLVGNSLVGMYAKSGLLEESQAVFDKLSVRDAMSWTTLVAGYGEHGCGQEALQCFKLMRAEGVSPDPTTYACVFQACGISGTIEEGQELHWEIAGTELLRHTYLLNSLISMYAKCGLLAQAREVFDNAISCDVVAWTTLISGYADFGPIQAALECFERMQLEGIFLDSVSFACALKVCGSIRTSSKGYELHMEVVKRAYSTDLVVSNTLVSMYSKCGLLLEAQEVFSKLLIVDRVSWNALIAG
eukprot:c23497_g1_i2 orf=58-2514(+)